MAEYTPCEIELSNVEAANLLISLYSDYEQRNGKNIPYLNAVSTAIQALNFINFNFLTIKKDFKKNPEEINNILRNSQLTIITE